MAPCDYKGNGEIFHNHHEAKQGCSPSPRFECILLHNYQPQQRSSSRAPLKHFWQSSEPWPFLTHHSFRSEPIVQSPEEHYSMGWQDYCWHFIKFPSHTLMTVSPYSLGLNSSWYNPLSKHAPIKTRVFILKRSTILLSVCNSWNRLLYYCCVLSDTPQKPTWSQQLPIFSQNQA